MATDHPPGADDSGFLSRWSRRKAAQREGQPLPEPPPAAPLPASPAPAPLAAVPAPLAPAAPDVAAVPPPPTLADVAALTQGSDYSRFVAPGVDAGVKNAALKKLFTDPHFNVMDGLDTYIDDYGIADPLPPGMLRQMVQSQMLGLFADDPPPAPDTGPDAEADTKPKPDPDPDHAPTPAAPADTGTAPPPPALAPPDEDASLRLQPHDAAGPHGAGVGAATDPGRQR